jgi:hypothetical protein
MNKILLIIIALLIGIVSIMLLKMYFKEWLNPNNNNNNNNNTNCDSKGCPVTKSQNDIYKMHVEYKPNRDKNHMIAHNTESGNYFFKTKGPKNIFIIRHGEKIKTKTALDCNGILRSTYIPQLIEDLNKKGFGINTIITSYDYNSMHQQQTVMLTSWLLNIPLFMYGDLYEPELAVNTIFTNPYFDGKTVLFCWEHDCIQTIIKNIADLGSKAKGLNNYVFKNEEGTSELPYWDENNYNSICYFDENLNFKVLKENVNSCYEKGNDKLIYGKEQICGPPQT